MTTALILIVIAVLLARHIKTIAYIILGALAADFALGWLARRGGAILAALFLLWYFHAHPFG